MAVPTYKFYLTANGNVHRVYPIWKDDLSLEFKMETQQRFYRSDLSSTIDFLREDYDHIMGYAFGTVFTLTINIVDGVTESEYWKGSFTHTDCKIDIDNKRVTVKPKAIDDYTDILAGLEREFNLIKLMPKIDKIQLTKRPALQIFDATSETVTTVCGNLSFETDVELPLENQQKFIREHCHFQVLKDEIEIDVTDAPMGYEAGFATPFIGTIENGSGTLTNSVGTYFILYEQHVVQTVGGNVYFNSLNVYSYAQPSDLKWKYEQHSEEGYQPFPSYIEFVSQYPTIGNLKANCVDHSLYSRVICNVNVVNGVRTFAIPTDDIVTYNRNYKRCYPYDATDMIVTSQYKTQTPTEWGVDDDGWYFLPPDSGNQYIPIGRNLWDEVSVWLKVDNEYETLESSATATYMLNDAYPLWSCIAVLLKEIAPEIKFQGTEDFSVFLYSGNEPLQGRDNGLWLTPKSNITNGEYKTPAQKAPVTLKQIFDMLRDVYKCYWFVENKQVGGVMTKCLRIEHVQYFLNGGSYDGTPTVGIDLTAMQNIRNGHYWSFGTNNYEYEKSEMPERYQFGWMDEVTEIFNGLPIIIVSDFVEKGRIEEINVANFTSDLDFMLLNPSGISLDGFALINALYDSVDDMYYVPVVTMQVGINTYRAQNGFLSYHMLQWAYWRYDMPARTLNIEGEVNSASRALSVSRNKKQTVSVPYEADDPDLYKLVKTGLGNGQIYQATIRLTSRMVKMQLRYDTEN